MKHILSGLAIALASSACSSSVLVEDLSTSSQISLCEQFLDDFCATPEGETFCDDPCIDTGCLPAAENGDIDDQCAGVFDDEVEDCGITGDFSLCASAGGCMIDALEAVCE